MKPIRLEEVKNLVEYEERLIKESDAAQMAEHMMATIDHSQVLRQFPYGLYLVGASRNGHPLVILANWVTQVSFVPPLVAAAIEVDSKMHQFIRDSGYFSVNVLPSVSSSW